MDAEVKREIIMEHYQNPLNKDKIIGEGYEKVNSANSSCIDNIDIYMKYLDDMFREYENKLYSYELAQNCYGTCINHFTKKSKLSLLAYLIICLT